MQIKEETNITLTGKYIETLKGETVKYGCFRLKTWLKCFLESLSSEELNIIKHERSGIIFKFGNRKICLSNERITIPIVNAGKNVFLTTEVSKYKIQC